jgi:thiol-disulfide isomerase/thioredoxin
MNGSFKVKIHLYDLSGGMARSFGKMLLGKDIEGIWHTGIEVYGKEFYYGGGICNGKPKQTPYGFPVKELDGGTTEIPEDIFLDFLREISPKFAMEKYDLFSNNCNNFTDECCMFLTGKPIPDYITGLPKEVLSTPLGQMIKPMMDQMQNKITQNSHPMFEDYNDQQPQGQQPSFGGGFNNNTGGTLLGGGNSQSGGGSHGDSAVIEASDAFTFNNILTTSKAVIVDFFSFTCPPCMQIKPVFEALAKDWRIRCPDIKFVKVDTAKARDIAGKYQIQSIPTFIGFYDGKSIERFSGASRPKVESLIYQLEKRVTESQGGSGKSEDASKGMVDLNVSFNIFNPNKKEPFTFIPDNWDVPIKKITQTTENDPKLNAAPMRKLFLDFAQNPKTNLKSFSVENKGFLATWLIETLFYMGISETTVPFVDMVRLLAADAGFGEAIVTKSPERVEELFQFMDKNDQELLAMPRGLKMIVLRTLTNITASPKAEAIFSKDAGKYMSKLARFTKVLKDDRASSYACLMLLFNLILLLEKNKEYKENRKEIVQIVTDLLITENEEKNQLALVVNLSWLIYDSVPLKKFANEKMDKIKLLKMESSENSNLRLATQDLISLLDNKL